MTSEVTIGRDSIEQLLAALPRESRPNGAFTTRDLMAHTGLSERPARERIRRMLEAGVVKRGGMVAQERPLDGQQQMVPCFVPVKGKR